MGIYKERLFAFEEPDEESPRMFPNGTPMIPAKEARWQSMAILRVSFDV